MPPALLLATASHAAPARQPHIDVSLAPRPAKPGGSAIGTVDVTLAFEGVRARPGRPLLQLALVADNVDTVAKTLTHLSARDTRGPLPLIASDADHPVEAAYDSESGGATRRWTPTRPTTGAITVRYTIPAHQVLPPRGAAPPTGLSDDADAVSAAGHVFLLMPPGSQGYRAKVSWDLSALPPGSRGMSSFGEGTAVADEPVTANELRMSYFMAGRIGTWPEPFPVGGFFSAWQGKPPFDAEAMMRWTGTLYDHYVALFRPKTVPPYGVFMRYNPVNAGGGTGMFHSFIITFWKNPGDQDLVDFKSTLAHEMFHTFQPYIEAPAGKESSWFGEGLAVFYEARLPFRYGLMTSEEFVSNVNYAAGRYYTSIMASLPNDQIASRFWADTRVRTLPYDRGALYFVTVDDALRKTSGGKTTLDDLVLEMLASSRRGRTLSNADWEAVLRKELGDGAVADFRAFLAGRIPVPASDAFGPCFERISVPMRRYELGFDPAVLTESPRIVRDIVPGSAAAASGLRNGDEIAQPVPQDRIQGTQDMKLTLSIRRDGKTFPITYLPRGETVDAYQWRRVPGLPDDACRL